MSNSDSGGWRRRLILAISVAGFVISTAGAIACAVLSLLSSVPVRPVPMAIWAWLFIGVFPSSIVLLNRNGQSQWTGNRALKPAFAFAIVCFISGFVQLAHGVPEIIHGAYYQDSHGTLTRVSHGIYLWSLRAEARMAGGAAFLFYVAAAAKYADRLLDMTDIRQGSTAPGGRAVGR
jgi:hypothetical protein